MSSTGRDLVSAALRLIGAVASGETPAAAEATDGLSALNLMIDSWSNESLLIPNKVREVFALTPSQQTYTMGTGGNFATSRPLRIEEALIQFSSVTPLLELPMKILNQEQYSGVLIKTLTSTFPLYLFPDYAAPLVNLNFWPVPNTANSVVLYSWKPLADLTTLDTATSLPPGYERALKYNLAVEIAPEYGKIIPDAVAAIAVESKAAIKRMNASPRYLRVDQALRPQSGTWNWMTGDTI